MYNAEHINQRHKKRWRCRKKRLHFGFSKRNELPKSVKTSRADTYKKEVYCGAVKRLATTNLKLSKHKKKPCKKNKMLCFPYKTCNRQRTFKQRNFAAQNKRKQFSKPEHYQRAPMIQSVPITSCCYV
jgi:hypothetical protein